MTRIRATNAAPTILAGGIAVFAARRLVLLLAVLIPGRRDTPATWGESDGSAKAVCVVVPARNEAEVIEQTLASLAALRGPSFSVVLVSDGSSDTTFAIMQRWAEPRSDWRALCFDGNVGKGAALNAGIAANPSSDLIAVCDADVTVDPSALVELVAVFADPRVGAASALLWPANPDDSTVTRYCALELWQHQLITSAAKERLRLNPPAHGWFSCYRREALEQSGGFPQRSLGEDVEVTNALIAAGWQTRFVASSIVFGEVPRTISDYWTQHVRWARGLHDATPMRSLAKDTTVPRRIELWLHAAGYTDRLLVLAATSFAAVGRLTPWLPAGYVGLVAAEAVCALGRAGRLRSSPSFIAAAATMFAADVAASTSGTLLQLARRERSWRATARNGVDVGRTTASTD